MDDGKLFSFEGQDATGKTTLISYLDELLRNQGFETFIVPEFSNGVVGSYLQDLLSKDKFLASESGNQDAFTSAMLVISDLFYLNEHFIVPALKEGKIVLKDRHIDSLFTCEIPKINRDYPDKTVQNLYNWMKGVSSQLYIPDKTFLLTLPEDEQKRRIITRGEDVSKNDLSVFFEREIIYQKLYVENPQRILKYNNVKSLKISTQEIAHMIKKIILDEC